MTEDSEYQAGRGVPPQELYLGMTEGQWPIVALTNEAHAIGWLQECRGRNDRRRLWKVRLETTTEMKLVPPSDPYLKPLESPGNQ